MVGATCRRCGSFPEAFEPWDTEDARVRLRFVNSLVELLIRLMFFEALFGAADQGLAL